MPEPQFIRFIYCYKLNGKPIYVGSAWNPARRDKAHCTVAASSFDRFLAKTGRKALTFELVEAFRVSTIKEAWTISAARENHWMDVLRTWHEFGGLNFLRASAVFDSEEQFKAWQAAHRAAIAKMTKDPAWIAAHAVGAKKRFKNPAWRKGHKVATTRANQRSAQNPAWQKSVATARERQAQNPVWRDSLLTSHALQRKARAIGMLPFRVKELRLYVDLESL